MYDFKKCVLGVAPTRRDVFPGNRGEEIMKRVRELAGKYGVSLVTIENVTREGLLVTNDEIPKIAEHFRAGGVDAVFVPHANFGQEEAVAKLCRELEKPVLLWGPRDPAPKGVVDQLEDRAYDVQCGLFATGKALLSYDVPFTYIENCWIDSPVLDNGFDNFIRVVCAAKALKGARVAQLSVRPWQFLTVKCNEAELLEKFGIEIVPIETTDIMKEINGILENESGPVGQKIAEWNQKLDLSAQSGEEQRKLASAVIAIKRLADRHGCRVAAGECWTMLQTAFGINACFVWGALFDEGLPVTCETDILGALGCGMMAGAVRGDTVPFFADITVRHPINDNAELLWHCGPFPPSLAREARPGVIGCKGQFEIAGGDITLIRMGNLRGKYTMFADEVRGVDGPKTNGTYVWIETDDWPKWERKFVTGPYIHHVTGAHGKYREIIHEALKYVGDIAPDRID
jgi:L-fucose isomerase-like protein